MTLDRKYKNSFPFKSLSDAGVTDKWTLASGVEYFYNQADLTAKPLNVQENGVDMTEGTLGSLAAAEWAWDSTNERVQLRLTDDLDPDAKAADFIKCSIPLEVFQSSGRTLCGSILLGNTETAAAKFVIVLTTSLDVVMSTWLVDVSVTASPWEPPKGILLSTSDKFLLMTDKELSNIYITVEEGV